jgi:beta-galactosidase
MDVAFGKEDWMPTDAGKALLRNNRPVLAYIAGKAEAFTSKDHNFRPGDAVEKQLVVINSSRRKIGFDCGWSLGLPQPATGAREVAIEPGQQARIPLRFELPATLPPGRYVLSATANFDDGKGVAEQQADAFVINVLPAPKPVEGNAKLALFDPRGETSELLQRVGISFQKVDAATDLSAYETLVVGKHALTVDGPAPDLARVREGLRVVVFEQSSPVLERRLGFRVVEYGLRDVFARIPDHPLLAGLAPEQLRDWRGEATTVPPRIDYDSRPQHGPTTSWCGIPVSRVWRCGNRGNVASVLLEKPARGDFRPVVDGGFSLQYAPLMEYREGEGLVLFCQLDLTGRTEADPAADSVVRNVFRYVAAWKPEPRRRRRAIYAGEQAGQDHLKSCGIDPGSIDGVTLAPDDHVLVLGPGGGRKLADHKPAIERFLKGGGSLLAIGIDQSDADAVLPFKVSLKAGEHIGAFFDAPPLGSPVAGVGPADVQNRGPRQIPLVAAGATVVGDGALAFRPNEANGSGGVVFWQLPPWQLDHRRSNNLKRTYRRASFTTTRLLANLGVAGRTPLLDRFAKPSDANGSDQRWAEGLYLDAPEEWDDPYRFFRW